MGLMQLVNISALNFMWVVIPAFAAGAYTPTISLERRLFYRERNDGLYRTTTYLACKMLEELAIMVAISAIVSVMVYFSVQVRCWCIVSVCVHACWDERDSEVLREIVRC